MSTTPYELSFEVAELTAEQEERLLDDLDALVAVHSGVTVVTVTVDGDTCLQAAIAALGQLRSHRVVVQRLVDDLVGRGEIARRAGVTTQAVGQWIRGERHGQTPFPTPYVVGSTELWLWSEVVVALRARGVSLDADVRYPNRRDIQLIGGLFAAGGFQGEDGWAPMPSATPVGGVAWLRSPRGQTLVDSKRTDFALGA